MNSAPKNRFAKRSPMLQAIAAVRRAEPALSVILSRLAKKLTALKLIRERFGSPK
jgi:hypothetical protein